MQLISLVIPSYNEEQALCFFYEETREVISKLPYDFELIFVNDGSKDGTLSVIKKLAQTDVKVKYISFSKNFGKESAIYAGLKAAKGDMVAVMDADMQDPPSLLPQMIEAIEQGFDAAATYRVNRKGEPVIRSFFARMFYKLINKITKVKMVDGSRDYRLMTRNMVDSILKMTEYHRFSKGIFQWVGFETKWIEYENIERVAGETKWSFWKLLSYAFEGIVAFTTVPLRFASISGFFISIVSFVYLIYIVFRTFFFGVDMPGYASTITIILFLSGIQLISIGILGEYMAKTYMEVKQRPLYIVKETNIKKQG